MKPSALRSRIANALTTVSLGAGALTLLVMTAIILAGVFARYLLRRPLPGITELIGEGLIVALIYLSLSSANHIRVSLVVNRLPRSVRKVIDFVVLGVCLVVLAVGVLPAWDSAVQSYRSGEATTGLITYDIYPFRFIIIVGLVLTFIRAADRSRRWLHAGEFGGPADEPELVEDEEAAPGPDQHV